MGLGEGIRKALARITGATLVDEVAVKELVKDLQRALISSDVNVKLVFDITKRIEERAISEKPPAMLSQREHVIQIVYGELVKMLGEKHEARVGKQKVMMLGLFGSGKTTTISKLAKFFQKHGLSVGVIAGDVHRPAAYEQLEQLSKIVNCGFYGRKGGTAVEIAREGMQALAKNDVIILDTAGRSAFDEELAKELKELNAVFEPDEKFLVVSADVGQVAGKQADEFNKNIGVTGVIVTKMDGSGKGGGALSSVHKSGAKVAFIGTGEKPDALEEFDATKFVAQLCGFPDLAALLEKAKEATEEQDLSTAMESGKLDYNSFMAQMKAMRKMGPLKSILQMMGAYDLPEELVVKSEEKMKKFEAIVHSMTPDERTTPDSMKNAKRQERVARGAGVKPDEVKELVNNFEKSQKMMKAMQGNRGLMKRFNKMGGNLGGLLGR
jgi:signal recognition particle subunit SRP54